MRNRRSGEKREDAVYGLAKYFRFSIKSGIYLPRSYTDTDLSSVKSKSGKWLLPLLTLLVLLGQSYILFQQVDVMRDQTTIMTKTLPPLIDQAKASMDQAKISLEAVKMTRDQFRSDRRPYIWFTSKIGSPIFIPIKVNNINAPIGQVVWTWHTTNYGRSPAYDIKFESYMKVGERPFVSSFGFQGPSIGAPSPPNKEDFATTVSPPEITQDEFNSLLKIDRSITVRGHIVYTDDTRTRYETGFCLARLASGSIQYCREGNYIK